RAEKFSARIEHSDKRPRRDIVRSGDIRTIDPWVAGLQERGPARREFYGSLRVLCGGGGFFRHEYMLSRSDRRRCVEAGLCPAWTGRSPVPTRALTFRSRFCPHSFCAGPVLLSSELRRR